MFHRQAILLVLLLCSFCPFCNAQNEVLGDWFLIHALNTTLDGQDSLCFQTTTPDCKATKSIFFRWTFFPSGTLKLDHEPFCPVNYLDFAGVTPDRFALSTATRIDLYYPKAEAGSKQLSFKVTFPEEGRMVWYPIRTMESE
ncbi:MAG: hypothetical protein ACFB10_04815 [Salibacteraceae bacterium]